MEKQLVQNKLLPKGSGAVLLFKEKAQVFNLNTPDTTQNKSIEEIDMLQRGLREESSWR